jgi:hypothetical protein
MGADVSQVLAVDLISNSGHLSALEVGNFDRTPPLASTRERA